MVFNVTEGVRGEEKKAEIMRKKLNKKKNWAKNYFYTQFKW